jgi:hypothetical protein
LFALQIIGEGMHSKRIAFNLLTLFEKIGGFQTFVFGFAAFLNSIFSSQAADIEMLSIFKYKVPKKGCQTFCYNKVTSNPRFYDKRFVAEMEVFESNLKEIERFLSI